MSFDIPRIHKWEENIERDITDQLYDIVFEFYGVDEITEITEEQMDEIIAYRDELNEYSPIQWGFSNLYNHWESETWEAENSEEQE
jgi:hypothetical protein